MVVHCATRPFLDRVVFGLLQSATAVTLATLYRTLNFLRLQGFFHHSWPRNLQVFGRLTTPAMKHDAQFFLCIVCGVVTEW